MKTLTDFCRETYGKKLYKLSLDGGFTCPTRDGTLGTRGCTFCAAGSGDFTGRGKTVDEQIEDAKQKVAAKAKGCGYIAYFRSYTGTWAPPERLRALYLPVAKREDIDVLSIATRPDCLGDGVMEVLKELRAVKPLWVELGLQTTRPESVEAIRRGYKNEVYADAVRRLKAAGIYVVTHMILGLPGETAADAQKTLRYALDAGTDGVKFHLLYVSEGTDLAADWRAGRFETLTMDEYIGWLSALLPMLPPDVTVHRLTGDGSKKDLLSPLWSGEKKKVLNRLNEELKINEKKQPWARSLKEKAGFSPLFPARTFRPV